MWRDARHSSIHKMRWAGAFHRVDLTTNQMRNIQQIGRTYRIVLTNHLCTQSLAARSVSKFHKSRRCKWISLSLEKVHESLGFLVHVANAECWKRPLLLLLNWKMRKVCALCAVGCLDVSTLNQIGCGPPMSWQNGPTNIVIFGMQLRFIYSPFLLPSYGNKETLHSIHGHPLQRKNTDAFQFSQRNAN